MDPSTDPGISVFFHCEIDAINLGNWMTCSGMGITIKHENIGDSAMSFWAHHKPGHTTYDNITLSRPVSPDTDKIITWMAAHSLLPIPTVAQITALDMTGSVIFTWALWGVHPVKWTGPSFDASTPGKTATEQLVIAYHGFL